MVKRRWLAGSTYLSHPNSRAIPKAIPSGDLRCQWSWKWNEAIPFLRAKSVLYR
jgi:hypothetical protein